MTVTQAAGKFGLSPRQIRRILARYREQGEDGLEPKSRRPQSNKRQTPTEVVEHILELREHLATQGLDNGPESIHLRLDEPRPSVSTIWRILKRNGKITPEPHKRPRSSYIRFNADLPNEMWQSDFTHWPLADGQDTEIISWLDDHSRYLLHASAHKHITGPIVVDTFTTTGEKHGLPASTLTDNGMVYTTRLTIKNNPKNPQPNAFEQLLASLGITQKNGAPGHPTTQGKIERYHQTLKKWLAAQPPAHTLKELNKLLADFQHIYNTDRPHRALGRKTPHTAYHAKPKAEPTITGPTGHWRVRIDTIDTNGTITLRYAGHLRHLGIGRAHAGHPIIALANGPDVTITHRATGEVLATFHINPQTNYQPKQKTDT